MLQSPSRAPHDPNLRAAARFTALCAVMGVGFFVVAAVWVGTCGGSTADTVACGAPQRTLLALGAPVILLIGGIRAFLNTYREWRTGGTWWAWQGAGWFLMVTMLALLTTTLPGFLGA
jgi:hypothetical protein